jgi:site-specific DNA-cytosine methylase
MYELSLFSGVGGGLLATKWLLGWTCVGYVEIDPYCQQVLAQRIKDGLLDNAPIYSDIRHFITQGFARRYRGMVDIVTGGFPCQPFSSAAHGNNTAKNWWPWMYKTIATVKPKYVFAENVQAKPIERAAFTLSLLGYYSRSVSVSASDVGADHIRKRYWLFAYTDDNGELLRGLNAKTSTLSNMENRFWKSNPHRFRVVNGDTNRLERLKAIGNAQVPKVVQVAWRALTDDYSDSGNSISNCS